MADKDNKVDKLRRFDESIKVNEYCQSLRDYMWTEGNIFVKGWCVEAGLTKGDVEEMCASYDDFRKAYDLAIDVQDIKVRKLVLDRAIDVSFAKEVMKNEHGWKEEGGVNIQLGLLTNISDTSAGRVLEQVGRVRLSETGGDN